MVTNMWTVILLVTNCLLGLAAARPSSVEKIKGDESLFTTGFLTSRNTVHLARRRVTNYDVINQFIDSVVPAKDFDQLVDYFKFKPDLMALIDRIWLDPNILLGNENFKALMNKYHGDEHGIKDLDRSYVIQFTIDAVEKLHSFDEYVAAIRNLEFQDAEPNRFKKIVNRWLIEKDEKAYDVPEKELRGIKAHKARLELNKMKERAEKLQGKDKENSEKKIDKMEEKVLILEAEVVNQKKGIFAVDMPVYLRKAIQDNNSLMDLINDIIRHGNLGRRDVSASLAPSDSAFDSDLPVNLAEKPSYKLIKLFSHDVARDLLYGKLRASFEDNWLDFTHSVTPAMVLAAGNFTELTETLNRPGKSLVLNTMAAFWNDMQSFENAMAPLPEVDPSTPIFPDIKNITTLGERSVNWAWHEIEHTYGGSVNGSNPPNGPESMILKIVRLLRTDDRREAVLEDLVDELEEIWQEIVPATKTGVLLPAKNWTEIQSTWDFMDVAFAAMDAVYKAWSDMEPQLWYLDKPLNNTKIFCRKCGTPDQGMEPDDLLRWNSASHGLSTTQEASPKVTASASVERNDSEIQKIKKNRELFLQNASLIESALKNLQNKSGATTATPIDPYTAILSLTDTPTTATPIDPYTAILSLTDTPTTATPIDPYTAILSLTDTPTTATPIDPYTAILSLTDAPTTATPIDSSTAVPTDTPTAVTPTNVPTPAYAPWYTPTPFWYH